MQYPNFVNVLTPMGVYDYGYLIGFHEGGNWITYRGVTDDITRNTPSNMAILYSIGRHD